MGTRRLLIQRAPTDDPSLDLKQARAIARLLEVRVRGVARPATAEDVLEITNPPRYLLKGEHGFYIARDGRAWTDKQRDAMVIPDRSAARAVREQGLSRGVPVRVVRLRRRGTVGLDGSRLRPDIQGSVEGDDRVNLNMSEDDALAFLAALTGATEDGEQH
jgi:hypothetical protein